MPTITNDQWWSKKVRELKDTANRVSHIVPTETYEKNGIWPLRKLAAMKQYLGYYATIMASEKSKGRIEKLIFIDLCSGSGLNKLIDEHYGSVMVSGSSLIGAVESRFDHHFFVEPRRVSANALEQRLPVLLATPHDVLAQKRSKAIVDLAEIVDSWRETTHFLCVVDYAGFNEVTFEEMTPLFNRKGDFILNVQWRQVARARQAASRTFDNEELYTATSQTEIRKAVEKSLKNRNRGKVHFFNVPSGKSGYSYDMAHAARRTRGNNPWLQNFSDDIKRRVEPYTESQLREIIFGGQKTLL